MAKRKRLKHDFIIDCRRYAFLKNAGGLLLMPFSRIDVIVVHYRTVLLSKPKKKTSSKRAANANDNSDFVSYKFFGKPNDTQAKQLSQNIGAARWMYNRLLADGNALYEELGIRAKNTPTDYKDLDGLEWLKEADSLALSNAQLNYERAVSDWLSGEKGRPRFKKKHKCKASYKTNISSGNIKFTADGLVLPKISGVIRLCCHREVRPGGKLKSVTVEHAPNGKWYFTILFEYPKADEKISSGIDTFFETGDISAIRHIGLDMSLPHLYVDSNGRQPFYIVNDVIVRFEKAYRSLEDRIVKEQRKLSHMVYDSNNYRKQCIKVAKLHAKAKQKRNDFAHQIAVRLARSYDIISIEDLDMSAMKQALKFGKSVSDNGWGNFIRILEEKCQQYGCLLIRVDKWFPSSKTCSRCGHVHKELKLSDREYVCPVCGHAMERDHQAAVNIDNEGMRLFFDAVYGNTHAADAA